MFHRNFEETLKAKLEVLQAQLTAEHRHTLCALEERIATLQAENDDLHVKVHLPMFADTSEGYPVASSMRAELPTAERVDWSKVAAKTAANGYQAKAHYEAGVEVPDSATLPGMPLDEEVAVVRTSTGSGNSPPGSGNDDTTTPNGLLGVPEESEMTPQATEIQEHTSAKDEQDEAPDSLRRGGGGHFHVLDVWDPRRSSAITSRKGSMQSYSTYRSSKSNAQFELEDDENDRGRPMPTWEARLQHFVVKPSSSWRMLREIIGIIFLMYDLVAVPLLILGPPRDNFRNTMLWITRCFWTLNIPMSMLTGYVSPQGRVELRPTRVARRFARTLLLPSCIIILFDWATVCLDSLREQSFWLWGLFSAVRLVRVGRLFRIQTISQFVFERVRSEGVILVFYLLLNVLALLGLVHFIACIWCGIQQNAYPYPVAFHYVLSLISGDQPIQPETDGDRLFAVSVLTLAFVISGAFVGGITTAMSRLQEIASQRSTQFAALTRFLGDYGISHELAARVHRNARHAVEEQKRHPPESSVELMSLISDPLKSEIHYEIFSPTLTSHPFFYLYNQVNPSGVRYICHSAVVSMSLPRGDLIFSENEVPLTPRMIFILSGHLSYMRGLGPPQAVAPGKWASEPALWTVWAHQGNLRSLTECRLLVMDAQRFGNIMSTFPTKHGCTYASAFVQRLTEAGNRGELSDLDDEQGCRRLALRVFRKEDCFLDVPEGWEDKDSQRRRSRMSVRMSMADLPWLRQSRMTGRRSTIRSIIPGFS